MGNNDRNGHNGHNGSLQWGRQITQGSTIQTVDLSKSDKS